MNIAFFSYEYPPETGGGGIGTYLEIITKLLTDAGHSVIVFTGTAKTTAFWENRQVFRIPSKGWGEFNEQLSNYFFLIHRERAFDVAECTDFQACGLYIKKLLPSLPIVVKLHTPLFLVDQLLFRPLPLIGKAIFSLGALTRCKWPKLPLPPDKRKYQEEFELIDRAEGISSPSHSIYNKLADLGFNVTGKTNFVPYPFTVSKALKNIKARLVIEDAPQIIFIGRLEIRKGVIDLADAIPKVLKAYPNAYFTFVGAASISPKNGIDMENYLKDKLKRYLNSVKFTGKLPHNKVTKYLASGDIFVFPSHYESFGIVCCEAMAAGKAVIGSDNGGMSEIIENGKSGIVVTPKNVQLLSNTICRLIQDDTLRLSLGEKARSRIESFLSNKEILESQINCYLEAVERCRNKASMS